MKNEAEIASANARRLNGCMMSYPQSNRFNLFALCQSNLSAVRETKPSSTFPAAPTKQTVVSPSS
jgi:hypothetical protein